MECLITGDKSQLIRIDNESQKTHGTRSGFFCHAGIYLHPIYQKGIMISLLVWCIINSCAVDFDGFQNLIGRFGPDEGFRIFVVDVQILFGLFPHLYGIGAMVFVFFPEEDPLIVLLVFVAAFAF